MSLPHPAKSRVVSAISFNQLMLPGHEPEFMVFTLAGGQNLLQGTVLGRVTATGLLKKSVLSAGDGSEVPMAVLAEDVSTYDVDGTTALDMPMAVIVAGYLNWTALVIDASHNVDNVRNILRGSSIYTRAPGYSG